MTTNQPPVALITGANKGLGLEIARQLAQQGIRVVLGSRDLAKGQTAAAQLTAAGLDAAAVQLDVTNPADIAALPAFFHNHYAGLDILINNAGISLDFQDTTDWTRPTAGSISLNRLRQTFETNFFAVVAITQTLLPLLLVSPAGRIVNQSSILGSLAMHSDPHSPVYNLKPFAYNSSKAALNAFTIHLAHELQDTPIKVNSAHPGWVKTDMGGEEAPMEIQDGAKTAVWLATLPPTGPTGRFFHHQDELPW